MRVRDKGRPLAGASTLNRLELGKPETVASHRYKRIGAAADPMDALLTDLFMESYATPPERIILDLDATDDSVHGRQEGRFYPGYYRHYGYLLLYIVSGTHILVSRLRTADKDASSGSIEELETLVACICARWPKVQIWIRADSGFCRDAIMAWCEEHDVSYLLGLPGTSRLKKEIVAEMAVIDGELFRAATEIT